MGGHLQGTASRKQLVSMAVVPLASLSWRVCPGCHSHSPLSATWGLPEGEDPRVSLQHPLPYQWPHGGGCCSDKAPLWRQLSPSLWAPEGSARRWHQDQPLASTQAAWPCPQGHTRMGGGAPFSFWGPFHVTAKELLLGSWLSSAWTLLSPWEWGEGPVTAP